MGILSTATTLLNVGRGVASTVFSAASGIVGKVGSLFSSKLGKVALGAGAVAILASDPKKGGFFSKAKDFFSGLKDTITGTAKSTALTAAVATMGVAENARQTGEDLYNNIQAAKGADAPAASGPEVGV